MARTRSNEHIHGRGGIKDHRAEGKRSGRQHAQGSGSRAAAHLVHADVALVTEHHLVAILPLWRAADVTHHVLVVLDAQTLLCFNGDVHVLVAHRLQLLQHSLQGDLIQLGLFCKAQSRDGDMAPCERPQHHTRQGALETSARIKNFKSTVVGRSAIQETAASNSGYSSCFIDSNKILLLAERREIHSAEPMRIIRSDSLNVQEDKFCEDAFCSEGSDKLWQHKVNALIAKTVKIDPFKAN